MEEHKWKGSYTLEAVFVVPVIFGIIFVILYLMFLFHDQVVLQGRLHEAMCKASETNCLVKQQELKKQLEQVSWGYYINHVKLDKKAQFISGKITAESTLQIPVLEIFMNKLQYITIEEKMFYTHPEKMVRYRKMEKEGQHGAE